MYKIYIKEMMYTCIFQIFQDDITIKINLVTAVYNILDYDFNYVSIETASTVFLYLS